MEEKVVFPCLEDVVNELKRVADRVRAISDEMYEYGQSDLFIMRFSEILNEEEKEKLQQLSWRAEISSWELYRFLEKKISELEEVLGDKDES